MVEDKRYCVYRHVFPNGKVYVGYTGQKPADRWCKGLGYKNQRLVYRAISRYGWDNIEHEVVASGLTHSQAVSMEIELIRQHDSTNPSRGYNITFGGDGRTDVAGVNHPMYGKHHTLEARRKISEANRGRVSPNKGKPLSEEAKNKIRKALRGRKNPPHTEEWNRKISISNMGVKRSEETRKRVGESHKKPIVQISVDGEFVREWTSAREAFLQTGIDASHISLVCRNIRKTAGGFLWKFKTDYKEV